MLNNFNNLEQAGKGGETYKIARKKIIWKETVWLGERDSKITWKQPGLRQMNLKTKREIEFQDIIHHVIQLVCDFKWTITLNKVAFS